MKVKYFSYIDEGIFVFQNCYLAPELIHNYNVDRVVGSFHHPEICVGYGMRLQGDLEKQSNDIKISRLVPKTWEKCKIELEKLNT